MGTPKIQETQEAQENVSQELLHRKLVIKDIHCGKGERAHIIYASLYDVETNELLISADLNYITNRIYFSKKNLQK